MGKLLRLRWVRLNKKKLRWVSCAQKAAVGNSGVHLFVMIWCVCVCAKVLSHSFLCILFPRRQTFFKVLLSNNSPGFWSSLLLDTVMCCSVLVKWGKLRIIICGESYRFYCTTGTCGTCCCWYLGQGRALKCVCRRFLLSTFWNTLQPHWHVQCALSTCDQSCDNILFKSSSCVRTAL